MERNLKDIIKILAVLAAVVGAVIACVLLIVKYKDALVELVSSLKEKCPCGHREEDDYADDELNCICDMDMAE